MKTCTKIILDALEAMASEVQLPAHTGEAEVSAVFKTISRENPEIFWFSGRYAYDPATARVALRYSRGRDWRDKMREIIDFMIRYEFRPERLLGLSDLEKVTYVYWWISSRCRYSRRAMYPDSIAGPLTDRYSSSEGFARAAKYLLGLIGVRSELVYGRFLDKFISSEHLCWNRVYIDGHPFHVDLGVADIQRGFLYDPTYGYKIFGGFLWDFFCLSDSDIARSRTIDDDCRTCACRHSLRLRDVGVRLVSCTCPGRPEGQEFQPWPDVHLDGEIVEIEPAPAPEPGAAETETESDGGSTVEIETRLPFEPGLCHDSNVSRRRRRIFCRSRSVSLLRSHCTRAPVWRTFNVASSLSDTVPKLLRAPPCNICTHSEFRMDTPLGILM